MNKNIKSLLVVISTAIVFLMTGCGDSNNTSTQTPTVEPIQKNSAEVLEAPPTAPAIQ